MSERKKGSSRLLIVLIGIFLPAALAPSSSVVTRKGVPSASSLRSFAVQAGRPAHSGPYTSLRSPREALPVDPILSPFQEVPGTEKPTLPGLASPFEAPARLDFFGKVLPADEDFISHKEDLNGIYRGSPWDRPYLGGVIFTTGGGAKRSPRRSAPPIVGESHGNDVHTDDLHENNNDRNEAQTDLPSPDPAANPLLPEETAPPLVLADLSGDPLPTEGAGLENSATVPEPITLLSFGLGLIGFLLIDHQRKYSKPRLDKPSQNRS